MFDPVIVYWIPIVIAPFGIVAVFWSAAPIRQLFGASHEASRKFVHVVCGVSAAFAPFLFAREQISVALLLIAAVLLFAGQRGFFPGIVRPGRFLGGPLMFVLAYALLLAIEENPVETATPMLVLAFADAAAALVGQAAGRPGGGLPHGRTMVGSCGFAGVAFLVALPGLLFLGLDFGAAVTAAGALALVTMATESLSPSFIDNFSIPVMAYVVQSAALTWAAGVPLLIAALIVGAVLLAVAARRLRWLEMTGAMALMIVAIVVIASGGWRIALLLLGFFASSSLLTRWRPDRAVQADAREGRRALQVFALGGLPAAMTYAGGFHAWDLPWAEMTAAVIASAAADTWATEIGRFSATPPRLIISGAVVPAGRSGGITPLGLFGAAAGALFIAALSALLGVTGSWILVAGLGFLGSIFDSFLGATVQASYRCAGCGLIVERLEHCQGASGQRTGGWAIVSNEAVNFLMSAAVAVASLAAAAMLA